MLMLSTLLIVPLVVFAVLLSDSDWMVPLVPLSAVVCFVGGLLRLIYALLFEDALPPHGSPLDLVSTASFTQAQLNGPMRGTALPPSRGTPVTDWRPRAGTAEIVRPPGSVTENTTKLLDKEQG
jgi:hypothetical protein